LRFRSGEGSPDKRLALDRLVPNQVGGWAHSADGDRLIPVGERPEEEAYDDLLTRYYGDGSGNPIMFLVAYGSAQTGNAQLHRPEACYPAAGFNLHSQGETIIPTQQAKVRARTLTAEAPGRTEQILYWSRIGDRFPTTSASQRWVAFRQALNGSAPDGALVRISMIHPDQGRAMKALTDFARALLATPNPDLRQLLTGRR
jgi:EpsI family protein